MNVVLLAPAALAGLVALLLPLLLHLARRSERTPTDFAALAWLTARARPRRHVRFDEWPLLLARLALVSLLVLVLARPALTGAPAPLPWVVAVPGVAAVALRGHPAPADARRRWLAPGWPTAEGPAPAGRQPMASLLRELDATLPSGSPLTVLVPAVIDGADAERPRLSRRVTWQVVADRGGSPATGAPGSGAAATHAPPPPPMPALAVRYRDDRLPQVRYLRAAAAAWRTADTPRSGSASVPGQLPTAASAATDWEAGEARVDSAGPDIAPLDAPLPPRSHLLAWLAPGAVPAPVVTWVATGGTLLLDSEAVFTPGAAAPSAPSTASVPWRNAQGGALLEARAHGRGRVLQWTQPLLPSR
ncbi:MAG TPA: BatA domain-containing protein, partial [Luteimonas sp.]|nr:BatA domain-containing protein [Luteimonas sp.]